MVDNRKSEVRPLGYLLRMCSFPVSLGRVGWSKADAEKGCEVVRKDAGRRRAEHRLQRTGSPRRTFGVPERSTIRPHHRDVLNHDARETLEV